MANKNKREKVWGSNFYITQSFDPPLLLTPPKLLLAEKYLLLIFSNVIRDT